ncbi:hypothetical protein GCM10027285_10860 [Oleiagrimonas citrea]|uniref:Uncharacterized protein n=1 Tax=Oleiagrimonas citrea TaxID=1665687 RepID=A0A846ZLK6_9GAMM|nr:hypothetical protein [Oleiagrimonas citrea]NKZ38353.1 hypothetical protein [Oleiagrimonas citrea]
MSNYQETRKRAGSFGYTLAPAKFADFSKRQIGPPPTFQLLAPGADSWAGAMGFEDLAAVNRFLDALAGEQEESEGGEA